MDNKDSTVEDIIEDIHNEVEKMFDSELHYRQALIDLGSFDKYSINNRLMLTLQQEARGLEMHYPVFKTFNEWKQEGISVSKGSKSYQILMPTVKHYIKKESGEVEFLTKQQAELLKKQDVDVQSYTRYFPKNCVFHISDTNSNINVIDKGVNTRFTESINKNGMSEEHLDKLYKEAIKVLESKGIKVVEQNTIQPDGYLATNTSNGKQLISIAENQPIDKKLNTLLHEVSHQQLEHVDDINKTDAIKELEAESLAYLMGEKLGVSNKDNTLIYLTPFMKQMDSKLDNKKMTLAKKDVLKNVINTYDSKSKQFLKEVENNIEKSSEKEMKVDIKIETTIEM